MEAAELGALKQLSRKARERILEIVYESGSGHVGAALSQVDILVALYARVLNIGPEKCNVPERDRFVLSKGHGGLGFVAVLAECGFIGLESLKTFGRSGSALGMHLDRERVPGVEQSTGSLGHGLGVAVGMALGARLLGLPSRTVCLLSDGECYEGSTWEAAQSAATHGLASLLAIVDRNRLTMDGFTEDEAPLEPLAAKWEAFGFRVLGCNGHDHAELAAALAPAPSGELRPSVLIAETVKGRGVDFMENQPKWHYGALDSEAYARALESVRRRG
jgi:transketolase